MTKYILIGALTLAAVTAQARAPVPDEQWDARTRLWLARAMVAEAGWLSGRDHAAIAHVLARRYSRARERYPYLRFIDVIRNYCAGLGNYRRSLTPRQIWLRSLWPSESRPSGWPRTASWDRHLPLWREAYRRSERFGRGELGDPCRGRAWHWGGTIDAPHGRMVAIDCGHTLNTFYKLQSRSSLRASL